MARRSTSKRSGSSSQHNFSKIEPPTIQRSKFNRTSGLKTAFHSGYLVPIFCDEALPGDSFSLQSTVFGRLATPIHPVMENLYLDTFFFAVPNRLLWENWQKFNGEQDNPGDSTSFMTPIVNSDTGFAEEEIFDYMGYPTKVSNLDVTCFHLRAYNLIYKEWFRSQDLQNSPVINTDDGPDDLADYKLLRRNKRHDYFTSALPFAQKGPAVQLPIGELAPVIRDAVGPGQPTFVPAFGPTQTDSPLYVDYTDTGASQAYLYPDPGGGAEQPLRWSTQPLGIGLVTDLSNATAATVNELREAIQLQRLYERDARGGTRYTEVIKSHFGVDSPDARMQRPEFLGGGSVTININPIAQTSETQATDPNTPQGNLAAFGVVSGSGGSFSKSFTEHCVLLGLVMVRADLNYQQGLERMYSRRTRWDYYWPALAHLGEQTILNKEIYAQGADVTTAVAQPTGPATPGILAVDDEVFGYQERFAEYRYKPSRVTGPMRSNHTTPLDTWHLAQDFDAIPVLDEAFLVEDPPIERIVAVPSEPEILLDAHFRLTCARPMPMYSVPGMMDHF